MMMILVVMLILNRTVVKERKTFSIYITDSNVLHASNVNLHANRFFLRPVHI